jgi:hypothetical protein
MNQDLPMNAIPQAIVPPAAAHSETYPRPPSRIGKVTSRKFIDGSPMTYTVLDEIIHIPKSNPGKAIYLQKLRFEDGGREEMRLCYYIIGYRGHTKGKWVYGQFATMIGKEDFEQIMSRAREKGWIA